MVMTDGQRFILKGNIIYSESLEDIKYISKGYLVCNNGKVESVYEMLPSDDENTPVIDYGDRIIIPGLVDLHTHAPQYSFRGFGMDLELIDWLNQNTFPEEAKYTDEEYAKKGYTIFANDLKKSFTTRACIFGTMHLEATNILMEILEETGIKCMAGKVNMDRNSIEALCEESPERSIEDTRKWVSESLDKYKNVTPILTPRFLPSCSNALMEGIRDIQKEYKLPVQSHLSENLSEIQWVKELYPETSCYGEAYDQFDLFGRETPTVMAHYVHTTEEEIRRVKENGVFIAHCPESNENLSSGIAPVRTYLDKGVKIGIGTDVAGGSSLSMFKAMAEAIKVSKLRWRLIDQELKPLTIEEVFYLATKGGGAFFGKVGSFEKGYEFDAIVLDDSNLLTPRTLSLKERLERMIYLSDERNLADKYVSGNKINL